VSDFLSRFAQRQLGELAVIRPNLAPRFAPPAGEPEPPVLWETETETAPGRASNAPNGTAAHPPTGARPSVAVARNSEKGEPVEVEKREAEPPEPASSARPFFAQVPLVLPASPSPAMPPLVRERVRGAVVSKPSEVPEGQSPSIPMQLPRAAPQRGAETSMDRSIERPVLDAAAPSRDASMVSSPSAKATRPRLVELHEESTVAPSVIAPERLGASRKASEGRQHTDARESTAHAADEPSVHVTIGRIEVTAVTEARPTKRAAPARRPPLSLDDYLAQRRRGER